MAASRLALLSRKIIKPSSPTPLSQRIHKLSLMDQMGTHSSAPFVFFYPKQETARSLEPAKVSQIFEKSLSKVLTAYYPFAGRVKDNSIVECNDMGVDLSEVHIDCPMSTIFHHPRTYVDDLIFPKGIPWSSPKDSCLVVAQLSHFECGGIALSACISHKVSDGYSTINFLRDWAMVARNSDAKPSPLFNGASIFKPVNFSSPPVVVDPPLKQNVSERYHFSATKLKSLKALISADSKSQNIPTTVEAITAFLCKCVNTPTFRPSLLIQAVNIRGTNNDALVPADLVGNAFLPFAVSAANKEELNYQRLVDELRNGKEKIRDTLKYNKSEELLCSRVPEIARELNKQTSSNDISIYRFTSLRKFPFHDINFGWGMPRKVDLATVPVNMFILLDNQSGGGLDVLVNLEQGEMSAFQSNDELLHFASPSSGL
uniref:Acylsugar acyltransferase n=1 Tax=Petunia axillaris TaxID=33119 RepID=A0A288QCY3_PETAX|nr:acylsugar acyltransferase [Petunia axillaris]